MPQCPQCSKPLRDLVRRCPTCQADLDLLVDYVSHLNGGLERAENLTRAGELGQAFWAVRQFDQVNQGRRWLSEVRHGPPSKSPFAALPSWAWASIAGVAVLLAFVVGYALGFNAPTESPDDNRQEQRHDQIGPPPPKTKQPPPPEPEPD
jgi:hypothetical protein